MESGGLLRPMPADALIRRPAQQADGAVQAVSFLVREADPAALHAPAFAPRPEKAPDPEADLDVLLTSFVDESEEDEPLEDAVPTASMPVPVCVPLHEALPQKKHSLWWIVPLAVLIGAAGYAAWKYDLWTFLVSL